MVTMIGVQRIAIGLISATGERKVINFLFCLSKLVEQSLCITKPKFTG
jgi:hypothetical protein